MTDKSDKPKVNWQRVKDQAARRAQGISESGRDIAPIPKIKNQRRRTKARKSFRFYCEAYFPRTFHMPWSDDHLKIIDKIERAVLQGGLFAMAMPRGFGKTSLCEIACLWALSIGAHKFIALIGADLSQSRSMLDSIKTELEQNELLLEDWPEVVYPIHALEGIYQRSGGQICKGKSTRIGWTADEVILPTLSRSRASSGIIRVAGVEGRIRGMKFKRSDGQAVRPSLVILDDPQTDESARSPRQIQNRLDLLNGAILNLAGPGEKISGIMPCTVIYPGDMADQILDRDVCPTWQGERTSLVYDFPVNAALWETYVEIRNASLKAGGSGREATDFYRENRVAMDEGARVAWDEWFNDDELSAIQHAMNLRHRDKGGERAFWSEYQNQPLPPEEEVHGTRIKPEVVLAKLNGMSRGAIQVSVTRLTGFVDVHAEIMYWMVCAWEDNYTGYIVDYGAYPSQPKEYFTLASITKPLSGVVSVGAGLEGRLYAGLEAVARSRLGKEWKIDGGGVMKIEKCLVDANWGKSTDVVYRFCRQNVYSPILTPTHGKYFGASSIPMCEYRRKTGDKMGLNWRMPASGRARSVRYAIYDTNYWKSFVLSRFATAMGDSGSLSLWGRDRDSHRLLLDHLASEYCVVTEGRGRKVDEWKMSGQSMDNHWLDCLVGCAVAASMLGVELFKTEVGPKKPKLHLSQMQKKRSDGVGLAGIGGRLSNV